jgi:hypothetical protein
VPADAPLFGDAEHLYYVQTQPDGHKVARALSACDGARATVPDFADAFAHHLRTVGRCLLLAEDSPPGLTVRLHDVATGKDRWRKTFAEGSMLASAVDPDLVGIVDKKLGQLTVLDAATGAARLSATIDPQDLEGAQKVHLLADDERIYVAVQRPRDPRAVSGGPWANVAGMDAISVNGKLLAFRRDDGTLAWKGDVPHQCIVLERFRDLPVIVCTARCLKWAQPGRGQVPFTKTLCFDKRSGKLVYEKSQDHGTPFHTMTLNRKTNRVELSSYQVHLEIRPGVE